MMKGFLNTKRGLLLAMFPVILASCTIREKQNVLPENTGWKQPSHFPAPAYTFGSNVYSQEGFELGKRLFFDPLLSANNTISCASCHKQNSAFADAGIAISPGINGGKTLRHSPAIFNMAWNTSFMWDGGVNHIEVMPLAPLTNPAEMGETIGNIIKKLNADAEYTYLFRQVFGRDTIDDQQMFRALAQYMSGLVSANAKYDRYITGKESFTTEEEKGLQLFRDNCASCHKEPLFTDYSFHNNGLDKEFADVGRYRVSQNEDDMGKFKVPTLRNITVSYPYMHDGRINTLPEVIEHYSDKIVYSPTLATEFQKNGATGLHFSDEEKSNLLKFLQTLTDDEFLNNPALGK